MAKKGENREPIDLQCTVCGNMRRRSEKNKKNTTDKLVLSLYCPVCKKHTEHKEKK